MKYKTVPISEIIEEIAMGPFGSNIKVECFVNQGIPVLNGSNVDGFKLSENGFRYVTKEKADSLGKANALRGDIIITHRGTLGQIVYIPQNSRYDRFVISQSQFRVRCNTKEALPEYAVYYFHTREGQYQLLSNKSQVGVPALGRPTSTFQSLFIPLPTIDQQKAIVATLSCIDEKIELNDKINENLEAQAQSIFKSWFVDFEPFRDGEFVDSELGPIPKGWRIKSLEDIAQYVTERIPTKHCNTENYISTENMLSNREGITSANSLPTVPTVCRYAKNDILISNIRPYFKKVWFSNKIGGCSNDILVIRAKHKILNGLLYSILYSDAFFDYATATSRGTKMPRGDKTAIMKYSVVLPEFFDTDIHVQELSRIVCSFQKKISVLQQENRTLANLRDVLLPNLICGEIEVLT